MRERAQRLEARCGRTRRELVDELSSDTARACCVAYHEGTDFGHMAAERGQIRTPDHAPALYGHEKARGMRGDFIAMPQQQTAISHVRVDQRVNRTDVSSRRGADDRRSRCADSAARTGRPHCGST